MLDITTRAVFARLDTLPGQWEVIAADKADPPRVCGLYPSAGTAQAALESAGFVPGRRFSCTLNADYDNAMRFEDEEGAMVMLARVVTPPLAA